MKGGRVTWELVHWSDTGTLTDDFLGFMIPAPSSPHCVPFCQLPKHLAQIMGLYLRAFHVKFWLQKNMLECFVTQTPLEQFPLFDPSHTQWPFQWTCQPLIDSSDDSRSRCCDLFGQCSCMGTNFVPTWNTSLCTDVPTPSEKNREKIFFWRRGDVCTQAIETPTQVTWENQTNIWAMQQLWGWFYEAPVIPFPLTF